MNTARLADAIHAPDALFESRRIPRQLEADHPPRAPLQVQALTGDVGGQQDRRRAVQKSIQLLPANEIGLAAVQNRQRPDELKAALEHLQRMPELGEDDDRLPRTMQQPGEVRDLAFDPLRVVHHARGAGATRIVRVPRACPNTR